VSINGILKVSAQGTDKVCAGQEYFVPPSPVQRPVNAVVMAVPTFTRKRQLSDDGNAENRSANGSRKSAKVEESASAATIKSDFSGLQNYCWNVLALVEHDEVTNSISGKISQIKTNHNVLQTCKIVIYYFQNWRRNL